MRTEIMTHNADILWNSAENANFNVDSEGRISVISEWNFIGRLVKWIDGNADYKVQSTVAETLELIAATNEESVAKGESANIYVLERGHGFWAFFFDAKRFYSPLFPADQLANKILANHQFSNTSTNWSRANDNVYKAAVKVIGQKDYYIDIPKGYYVPGITDKKVLPFDFFSA